MSNEILIHTVIIQRAGEQQFFQVNIPRNTTAVTGIGTSVQLIDCPALKATGQMGQLQLQAIGRANVCYNSIVKLEPIAALKLDLGLSAFQAGFTKPNALLTNGLTYMGKTSPESMTLPAVKCLYGNYADFIGKALGENVIYRVGITFWTTTMKL